jgi:hypothetical protein
MKIAHIWKKIWLHNTKLHSRTSTLYRIKNPGLENCAALCSLPLVMQVPALELSRSDIVNINPLDLFK